MNANAQQPVYPPDLTKRILSQGSPRLWMGHYLRDVGTKEDLDQIVWEVCLDPQHFERVEKKQWLSLGGFVAAKMRSQIMSNKRVETVGDMAFHDQTPTYTTAPEELFEDPWETYIGPEHRELVKDRFYAGDDRAKQEALLKKYGLSSTSALRMRALRAVNAAKRKHHSLD